MVLCIFSDLGHFFPGVGEQIHRRMSLRRLVCLTFGVRSGMATHKVVMRSRKLRAGCGSQKDGAWDTLESTEEEDLPTIRPKTTTPQAEHVPPAAASGGEMCAVMREQFSKLSSQQRGKLRAHG